MSRISKRVVTIFNDLLPAGNINNPQDRMAVIKILEKMNDEITMYNVEKPASGSHMANYLDVIDGLMNTKYIID